MTEKTDLWARLWAAIGTIATIAREYEEENRELRETIERLRVLAANRTERQAKAEELAGPATFPPELARLCAERHANGEYGWWVMKTYLPEAARHWAKELADET